MGIKVMIVESDLGVSQEIADVVTRLDHTSCSAATLAQAREVGRFFRPDVVIAEVRLPDGPAIGLVDYLRRLDDRTEFVFLTGDTSFGEVVEAMRLGVADFQEKPISADALTAAIRRAETARSRRLVPADPPHAGRVLVLDDETIALMTLSNLLSELQMIPRQAKTIGAARRILEEDRVDLVLTDVFLDGESGLDFLREVKESHPIVPVIVVTASTKPEIAIEALRSGAFDVIIKGGSRDEIQTAILSAYRYKNEVETRFRLERELAAFKDGLAHLMTRMKNFEGPEMPVRFIPVRSLIELPVALILVDGKNRLEHLNKAAQELLRLDPLEVEGQPIGEIPVLSFLEELLFQVRSNREVPLAGQTFLETGDSRLSVSFGLESLNRLGPTPVLVHFQL